uniref:Cytochrome P450, family 2, subfamily AD, polypeptide 6 n=1 Tax=Myripristis murdjan TaxID=586833 RepID=A0A667XRK3_9TELE
DLLLGLDVKGILLFIFSTLLLVYFFKKRNPPNFPPGPLALPLLGNVLRIDNKQPNIYLTKLADAYGNVFCIRLGRDTTVFVSGYKMVKEALVTQAENFMDRPDNPMVSRLYSGNSGRPFNPHYILKSAVGNVISAVVFGHRFEYRYCDHKAHHTCLLLITTLKIVAFLQMEIQKHQEEWNPEDPQDYIDTYLAEIEKRKGDPHAGFNTETLTICTLDLFEAGTETAATTLRWALVFMMNYPEIQEKVQAEIDRVIGQSRQPTIADRPNLPYTDAVNHETQRMGNIVPLGFPKMAGKDATLGGYFIPKLKTPISVNLSSVLFDKNEWETPDTFNPEHFLDSEGQFRRREAFLPFSAGKRACLDEHLARMELFVFFASLLQLFTFTPVPGEMPSLEGVMGFTYSPEEFKILAMPR